MRRAVALVVALTAIIGTLAVVAYLRGGNTAQATNDEVAQRARAADTAQAVDIGPNMTIHQVVIEHATNPVPSSSFSVPSDSKTETWAAFGVSGDLTNLYAISSDLPGTRVLSTQVFTAPSTLVITDFSSLKTITSPHYSLTEKQFAKSLSAAIDAVTAEINEPNSPAVVGVDADGVQTYILTTKTNRVYIDKRTYRALESEELTQDGSVRKRYLYRLFETVGGTTVPTVTAPPPGQASPLNPSTDAVALDADPSTPGSLDASRTITGSAQFSLGINVTADADPYKGYQWEIEYPPAGLAFDDTVAENTSATGLGVCTNSAANPNATPITPGDTVFGNGSGCLTTSSTFLSSYVGQTTTFKMHCLTTGTFTVQLVDITHDPQFGATLLAKDSSTLDTGTSGITITCQ